MGFLAFLQRWQQPDKDDRVIKSQAYEFTTPSRPPIKGDYPVRGNGPGIMQDLRASRNATQVSLTPSTDAAAPAPTVPRCAKASDRPRTAPNVNPGDRPRPPYRITKRENRQPPVSLAHPRSVQSASTKPDERGALDSPRRFTFLRRSGSMRSERAHVDVLDAQSELKPADFRGRVRAAGARDYGEDVADRNMGQNGLDLYSEHVREYYASARHVSAFIDSAPAPVVARSHFKAAPTKRSADSEPLPEPTSLTAASLHFLSRKRGRPAPATESLPDVADWAAATRVEMDTPSARGPRRLSTDTYVPTGVRAVRSFDLASVRGRPRDEQDNDLATVSDAATNFKSAGSHSRLRSSSPHKSRESVSTVRRLSRAMLPTSPPAVSRNRSTKAPGSFHTVRSSISSSILSYDTAPAAAVTPPAYPRGRSVAGLCKNPSSACSLRARKAAADERDVTSSLLSASRCERCVPRRHSSLRHSSSASSVTPTTSTLSSWCATSSGSSRKRPHSRHTATTSIDTATAPRPSAKEADPVCDASAEQPTRTETRSSCYYTAPESRDDSPDLAAEESARPPAVRRRSLSLEPPTVRPQRHLSLVVESDGCSDSDDSFVPPQPAVRSLRPSARTEHGLLFRSDGYGLSAQLPGLFDGPVDLTGLGLPAVYRGSWENLRDVYCLPAGERAIRGGKRIIIDFTSDEEDEPQSRADNNVGHVSDRGPAFSSEKQPRSSASSREPFPEFDPSILTHNDAAARRGARRSSALAVPRANGPAYDGIAGDVTEERDVERAEAMALMRMRKGDKTRQRLERAAAALAARERAAA